RSCYRAPESRTESVSAILDALRRNQPDDDDPPRGDSHSEAVLATLGYPRERPRKRGLSIKMLLVYGAAAVTIGFVGLSLLIAFFAPPEPPPRQAARVATRPIAPASKPPVPVPSTPP